MERAYFTCKSCELDYRQLDEKHIYATEECHDEAVDKPKCFSCGERNLQWVVEKHDLEYGIWFDGFHQTFRDIIGNVVPEDKRHGGDFACPVCSAPSAYLSCTAHYEVYECINGCGTFSVS